MKLQQREKTFLLVLLGLVALDHFTKILAYHYLDNEDYEYIISNFLWLERYVNPKPFEHLHIANVKVLTNYEYWNRLASMILIPLLFGLYMYTKNTDIKKYKKYLLGLLLIMVYMLLVGELENTLVEIEPNKVLILIAIVVIGNVVLPLGVFIVNDSYFKTLILLSSAGNLGNLISFLYHPYRVVDMMGFRPTNYVYNFADIYGYSAELLFYLSPIYVFIIWRQDRHTGPNTIYKSYAG